MKPEPVLATLSSPHLLGPLTCGDSLKTRSDLRVQKSRLVEWSMKGQDELTYRTAWCDPHDPQHRACDGKVKVQRTDDLDRWDTLRCDCECHRRKK